MLNIACTFLVNEQNRETCAVDVKPAVTISDPLNSVYTLTLQSPSLKVETLRVSIFVESEKAYYLSSGRTLTELKSSACPPVPAGRFMVVETRAGIFKLDLPWILSYQVSHKAGGIEITTVVRDKNRCGISQWGRHKIIDGPQTYSLNIYCAKLASVEDCLWLEPYPGGARAALCLTDHADFDSVEKLHLLSDLFIKNDFRCTKSVFPHSDPSTTKNEPGLDIPEYRTSIEKLYASGTEIAIHGFSPRKNPPATDECRHRVSQMASFCPSTWIDHGVGSYLFANQNMLEGGIRLTDLLGEFGIQNYWSFTDIWNNPFTKLSVWSSRTYADIFSDLWNSLLSIKALNAKALLYLFDHPVKNVCGSHQFIMLRKKPLRKKSWVDIYRAGKLFRSLWVAPFALYGQDGTCFGLTGENDLLIFDTLLLNHLGMQLKPAIIDSLIKESGLLVAHCYFGAQHAYIADNCFSGDSCNPTLNPSFVNNIEYISERQQAGELISLSFAQLRASLETFSRSTMVRQDQGWKIEVTGGSSLVIGGNRQAIAKLECAGAKKCYQGDIGFIMLQKGSNLIKKCA